MSHLTWMKCIGLNLLELLSCLDQIYWLKCCWIHSCLSIQNVHSRSDDVLAEMLCSQQKEWILNQVWNDNESFQNYSWYLWTHEEVNSMDHSKFLVKTKPINNMHNSLNNNESSQNYWGIFVYTKKSVRRTKITGKKS